MASDLFGDSELFDEFEKERETQNAFAIDDLESSQGKLIFTLAEDSSSSDSDSEVENGIERTESENKTCSEITAKDILKKRSSQEDQSVLASDKLSETSHKVLHERNKYFRYAKIIDSTRFVPDEESPAVQVLFHNNSFSRKYRPHIEEFLADLIHHEMQESRHDNSSMAELQLQSNVPTCADLNPQLPIEMRTNTMWMAHTIIGNAQFHQLFLIDSRGWPLINFNPNLTDGWEIPKYEQVYEEPMPVDEDTKPQGKKASRPKPACFNCGGEHIMSECKEPKDYNRIKKQRREFMDKSPQMTKKLSLSSNKDSHDRFSKFKPGVMSPELRDAMGLQPRQLPMHIYRMRMMGYPPGWLKEAEDDPSGLVMFDKDGREINLCGESLEDGEVSQEDEAIAVPEVKIDATKIIEYPGFTVPVPKDMIDECEQLSMPALQSHQLKNTLEQIVETTNTEKKRKMEEEEEEKLKRFKKDNPEIEMELSDEEDAAADDSNKLISNGGFVPPLPIDTPPSRPPVPDSTPPTTPINRGTTSRFSSTPAHGTPPPLPDDTPPSLPPLPVGTPPITPGSGRRAGGRSSREATPRSGSPSLEILEEQYQLLVQQLGGGSAPIILDSCEDDSESNANTSEVCGEDSQDESVKMASLSRASSTASLEVLDSPASVKSPDSEISRMNSTFKATESMSKEYSTPIVRRDNSYTSLPDAGKFGVGVEDHIPFENLPDSTGTFDKMRGLIKLIRDKVSLRSKKKKT